METSFAGCSLEAYLENMIPLTFLFNCFIAFLAFLAFLATLTCLVGERKFHKLYNSSMRNDSLGGKMITNTFIAPSCLILSHFASSVLSSLMPAIRCEIPA